MRIPDWWQALILVLAAYRLLRFLGWDDWPPILKARAALLGEFWVPAETVEDPTLPGKTPESEAAFVRPAYRRPLLAHLWHCPFCLGWWVCLTGWAFWLVFPHAVVWLAVPWAASGTVGLIAKNLDP